MYIKNNVTPPNMNSPKNDIQSEAPRYNLLSPLAPQNKRNTPPNYKNPSTSQNSTPPFCNGMPKCNHKPSSKGGGEGE